MAAAAHLSERKQHYLILEAGPQVAHNVKQWQHVPMFSPWLFNIDEAAVKILEQNGWERPNNHQIPTGKELTTKYLLPLADTKEIKPFIRFNKEVIAISRKRISKIKDYGRDNANFVIRVKTAKTEAVIEARAVIDASGTWQNPKPAGADGLPAIGEANLQGRIYYGIPEVLGKEKERYLGKNVAVIGGGHSAINALLELSDLNKVSNPMHLHWLLTKASVDDAYGGLDDDELPGRGKVGNSIKVLVDDGKVEVHTPFFVERMGMRGGKVAIMGQSSKSKETVFVDEIIVATGLKPNLDMLRELRIALDEKTESPVRLSPLIDPNIHSCGSVAPHGEAELSHPEKNFYIVGMKSYGRAPTFLLATGYEQVRSVVAALVGDWKAAKKVQLKLPETGVCGVPKAVDPNSLDAKIDNFSC